MLLELIRPLTLAVESLTPVEPADLFVLIELPIRQPVRLLELEVDWLTVPDTGGVCALIEAPIRPVLLGLIRAVALPTVGVPELELVILDVMLETEPEDGLRALTPMLDRELVIRLDVTPLGGRLTVVLLG